MSDQCGHAGIGVLSLFFSLFSANPLGFIFSIVLLEGRSARRRDGQILAFLAYSVAHMILMAGVFAFGCALLLSADHLKDYEKEERSKYGWILLLYAIISYSVTACLGLGILIGYCNRAISSNDLPVYASSSGNAWGSQRPVENLHLPDRNRMPEIVPENRV